MIGRGDINSLKTPRLSGSRFKVQGWLPYLYAGLCSSFSNLEHRNCEPEKFIVSVSSVHSPLQILTSLLSGTLSESIHVPVVRPRGHSAPSDST